MLRKQFLLIPVFIFFLGLSFLNVTPLQAQTAPPSDKNFEIMKNLDIYSALIKELNKNYVDEINPGELTKEAIDGMLSSLDPYTNYIPESQVEDYRFMTTGEYGGIGALIHKNGDYVVISEVYQDFPAQKSGLLPGDKVLEVNGKDARGKNNDDVSAFLKGQAGTPVTVKVDRDGQIIQKEITRENIKIGDVPYSGMVSDGIGYIKLISFTDGSAQEVKKAFLKLKENPALKGVILDLRDNGGGLLNEAVDIVNIFVDKDQMVVSTKGKLADKNHEYPTRFPANDVSIPLVVLVNGNSASASEITAGSIQDLDRGIIVGQRTFGKGLVQNVVPLSYNAQVKITVAKYYIPSGRCIQAIDYSHHDDTLKVIKDSIGVAFKTKNGRLVYDGHGIAPDVKTEPREFSNISLVLFTKYLIFDFGTQFQRKHDSLPGGVDFHVSDDLYNQFLAFIADKKYDYTSRSEKLLEQLKKSAEDEHYFDAIKDDYESLKTRMMRDKTQDLQKFREEIKDLIRVDIVSRYYYQRGKIAAALEDDAEVKKAAELLLNTERYSGILSGKIIENGNRN